MTQLLLALIAILLVPGFINTLLDLTVYGMDRSESNWRMWERFGFHFVVLTHVDGHSRIAHTHITGSGAFCKYRDCHGLIELKAEGATSDAVWSWRPLSKGTFNLHGDSAHQAVAA